MNEKQKFKMLRLSKENCWSAICQSITFTCQLHIFATSFTRCDQDDMWQHVDIISISATPGQEEKRDARVETDWGGMGAHDCRTHDFAARHEQLRCINLHQRAPRLPLFNWEPWDVACHWKQKLITSSCVWCICLHQLPALIIIIWFGLNLVP